MLDSQKPHIERADYMLNVFKCTWMVNTPNPCIIQGSTTLVYLNEFVWVWVNVSTSWWVWAHSCCKHVNVYVSDYEYMDVSITDLICYHIQVNVWAVIMSEQVWEHVCASQCDLVHVYNHMCKNEHGSLFKYEFVCWSKWTFHMDEWMCDHGHEY